MIAYFQHQEAVRIEWMLQSEGELVVPVPLRPHAGDIGKAVQWPAAAENVWLPLIVGGKGIAGKEIDSYHRGGVRTCDYMGRQFD